MLNSLVVRGPGTLELVEDAVVLVEGDEFASEVVVHLVDLHGLICHVQVPD